MEFIPPPRTIHLSDMLKGVVPRSLNDIRASWKIADISDRPTLMNIPALVQPLQEQKGSQAEVSTEPPITVVGVGDTTLSREGQSYCADKAAALSFANGKGALIVVADGIGMGGAFSVEAAQRVVEDCSATVSKLQSLPTVPEARVLLRDTLLRSARAISAAQGKYTMDYFGDINTMKKIQQMGAAASIGITCIGPSGERFLLTANRGDCEINVIDVNRMEQRIWTQGSGKDTTNIRSSVEVVTKADAVGNTLTRSVREEAIRRMAGAMGEGWKLTPLPEHAIAFATSDGWRKLVPHASQEEALMAYYRFSQADRKPVQAFADCFSYEAQTRWRDDPIAPRDDISAAVVELRTGRQNYFPSTRRVA